MKKLILSGIALVALLFVGLSPVSATLPPCESEDSINCYWDAQTMGNGQGSSFVNIDGQITYTTPAGEHTCAQGAILSGERQCIFPVSQESSAWAVWDSSGASSLLPDYATTVTYLQSNTTGFPLTADTIVVWDAYGNFHQFLVS